MTAVKDALGAAVRADTDALLALSHRIHASPELAFEEERAAAWVAEAVSDAGFDTEVGAYGLATAVRATRGSGPLHVAVCAEYDALPGMGHACGHNVIAAAAVGAARALGRYADDLGLTVTLLGTPAEEGGGGKVLMLERGAWDGVAASMMVHPAPIERDRMDCLAITPLRATYTGREAHASAFPEAGLNAADALTVAQVGLGLLRQHFEEGDRVHGIVTHGGDRPNVVPGRTTGEWYVRARDLERLAALRRRVEDCLQAGALATGCTLELAEDPTYTHDAWADDLCLLWRANAEALGRVRTDLPESLLRRVAGSTDMANVSHVVPSIHPMLGIDGGGATNHQPGFAAACARPDADRAVLDGATGMAWTAADLAGRR